MRRILFLFLIIAGLAGWAGASGFAERWAIYPFNPAQMSPADAGAPNMHAQTLTTQDGETLIVWVARPKRGKPVILYFHGNAGNLGNRASRFTQLIKRGYGIVAPAYRGSSGSTNIVIYGESLGTGVSVVTATALTNDDIRPTAMVLESPYLSIPEVARHLYPQLSVLVDVLKNQWDTKSAVPALKAPLLVLHGADNAMIPPAHGQQVHALAGSKDKVFFKVPGATHNTVWTIEGQRRLYRFLARF